METLTAVEVRDFIDNGFVRINGAFPVEQAIRDSLKLAG